MTKFKGYPEKIEEIIIESCENCGQEGYGRAWFGKGRATGSMYGDAYVPTGSVVFCKDCAKDFRIGKEWNGEEIWKKTSDLEDHKNIRINAITKKSLYNKGFNEAIDLFTKEILARSEVERIAGIIRLRYFKLMFPNITESDSKIVADSLAQAISKLFREGE